MADQLWFSRSGNDLDVNVIGTDDHLRIENWYAGPQHRVERFETSDGHVLVESMVQQMVQAMAAFSPPAAGQTTLPPDYRDALAPVIAADWR